MRLDLDQIGAAIKLAERHEQMIKPYASMHDEVQKAGERTRDIVDPLGLQRMREMRRRDHGSRESVVPCGSCARCLTTRQWANARTFTSFRRRDYWA
jgi:hypothetical protein